MFLIMPCSKLPSQSLQWGKADTLSKLPSCLSPPVVTAENGDIGFGEVTALSTGLPPIPMGTKLYLTADIPLQLISIMMNDWLYSDRLA